MPVTRKPYTYGQEDQIHVRVYFWPIYPWTIGPLSEFISRYDVITPNCVVRPRPVFYPKLAPFQTKASARPRKRRSHLLVMAKAAANGPSWTPASYWARPNSREVSILRADPDAEDATALLGLRFSKLPTELLDDVVVQLPSSTDVMTLAGVSSLWRVSVWRALARRHTQAWQYAGLVRAQFPCMHKGNAKQLRWPVEFDDVAPAVLSHQPWLKSVSWDDFKTWQAGVAAFLAQDARPPLEPITCSEELFAKSLPDLSDISISVRLLHGCTLIGSHDGCAQEFKLHRYGWAQEAVFDLYALDALALNDCHSHPCLMP